MAKTNRYNTTRMAEIIICLIDNFGTDSLIKYLIERLIRKESDSIVPFHKSIKVVELEQKYGIPLSGLSRSQIYNRSRGMSKEIIIEHGLPEGQAIEMIFKDPKKAKIKIILEDIKNNLVYITKKEHDQLSKDWRIKGKNGYYWEDVYKKGNIEIV